MKKSLGLGLLGLAYAHGAADPWDHYVAQLTGTNKVDFVEYHGFTHVKFTHDLGSTTCTGGEFTYHIHDGWSADVVSCNDATTCAASLGGKGIVDTKRCTGNARPSETCDPSKASTCAVGDMSGRHGKVSGAGTKSIFDADLAMARFANKAFMVHCASDGRIVMGGKIVAQADGSTQDQPATTFNKYMAEHDAFSMEFDANAGRFVAKITAANIPAEIPGFTAEQRTACLDSSLSYHIHQKWTHTDKEFATGTTDCGPDATGGHWDPYYACGGASQYKSLPVCAAGTCGGAAYPVANDAFGPETGDISVRFGKQKVADVVTNKDAKHFDLPEGLSVVYHCDGGARVFCAKMKKVATLPYESSAPAATASGMLVAALLSALMF